ncbi:FAD-dependent oxidoreductase [Duganella sp. FT135W]|uniref:FAD-dependent oxidoreductase n=1 Tax=Duganella flavida TaxID=2692175 RepID=A0A6L8K753_9BURK|nr:FAD/NAD(P)-binding oxidoreductase [Duganella flavida]MYM23323.1 FAD-dependent oxidoreductase [Duganella flavida]
MKHFDVLIVGAGPAGLAAAHAAAAKGAQVGVIDDNPLAGGQIWRGGPEKQSDARAPQLWHALHRADNVEFLQQTRVMYAPQPNHLLVQTPDAAHTVHYKKLILATGARERLLPFPGWTLPGVTGAGGLQALSKGGYPLAGKRVVVAGSGPLLLAAAATLKNKGAHIVAIIEQANTPALVRFAFGLLATPSKISQALQLASQLRGVPYLRNSYVHSAHGDGTLQSIQVQRGAERDQETLQCDYLACGYGLLPNVELAQALGCDTIKRDGQTAVAVDEWQQTSVEDVYCAGEGTGVGGVDLALAEGRIAGLAAVGDKAQAKQSFAGRAYWQRFAARLARAFALRPELRTLAGDDTIVCRCEDVCHGELRTHTAWRSAKLQTRCGMGPCQGRICGGATEILYGWRPDAVRMPISPTRISSIID